MQRPLLHLNWTLEQEWLHPASSLLSPQSLSGQTPNEAAEMFAESCKKRGSSEKTTLTIVASPVDVDAAAVGAGELGERETGGIGCREGARADTQSPVCSKAVASQPDSAVKTHHTSPVRPSGLRSHHPGHTSRRWGCTGHWHTGTGLVDMCELARNKMLVLQ